MHVGARRGRDLLGPSPKNNTRIRRIFQTLDAPSVFSIVNNPDAAMQFFANLELYSSRYNINIDLSNVETLTTDAIAALIATLRRLDINVRGNLPGNADARRMLLESGFFAYVSSTEQLPQVKRDLMGELHSLAFKINKHR